MRRWQALLAAGMLVSCTGAPQTATPTGSSQAAQVSLPDTAKNRDGYVDISVE
ncbi:MAG: hypothetical protein KJZ86_00900 [Caldilineaceae bacterium]|nr:hypothetical protein [Caldilineaceae bacterium]HRJ41225.1 hypothetical protein [Caldilineaceae bacterium]